MSLRQQILEEMKVLPEILKNEYFLESVMVSGKDMEQIHYGYDYDLKLNVREEETKILNINELLQKAFSDCET